MVEISRFFIELHIFLCFKNWCFLHSLSLKNILQNCLVASKPLKALRATAQGDCWLCFSPPTVFLPLSLPPPPARDSITAHPARAVVFHCCERMQIAIPVPGPSINSNRINSSAVIVFCASQKTLYTRAASRFAPLWTISGSYERLRTSSSVSCIPMVGEISFGNWTEQAVNSI